MTTNLHSKTEFALTYEDLVVTLIRNGSHERVLGPLTGCVKSGQISCIIGHDKQCADLLDALSWNFQPLSAAEFAQEGKFTSGTISWNGQTPNLVDPRVIARLNQQFDPSIAAHLSSWEILLTTVKVRVPNLTGVEQASMVEMILDMLNIQEKSSLPVCRLDPLSLTLLNIGREVVGCSGILLLRNPFVNGLTPADARSVVTRLRLLAEKHCYCIIMTMSQATSGLFACLTEITVLSLNGAALYHGPAAFAKQVISFHGQECPEDYNFLDFLLQHICLLSDATVDAMVIYCADSDFSKATRRAASDIRSRKVQLPTLIERRRPNELQKRTEQGDLKWFASMLRLEWNMVSNDPNVLNKFFLFPLVLGTVVGCIFFGLPRDSVGAQERAGFFFLLLTLFCVDAVFERSALRKRIFWTDALGHRVNVLAYVVSCLFGELILKRGAPIVMMVTGSYIFMGLAESLVLYLEFVGLALLGSWSVVIALFAFDLAVFACDQARASEEASLTRVAQTQSAGVTLKAAAGVLGAVLLSLGVLTMGCPLTARDVPMALGWVGYCLPLQSVFSAMMANQVGAGLPDGEGLLNKMGAKPHGHLLLATAIPLVYLAAAVHMFLLQFPEPESGPASRLQGHVLDSCLNALERAVAWCGRAAAPLRRPDKPSPQRGTDGDTA